MVNSLHDALVAGENFQIIKEILDRLASHTVAHFQTEEELMIKVNYPEYEVRSPQTNPRSPHR